MDAPARASTKVRHRGGSKTAAMRLTCGQKLAERLHRHMREAGCLIKNTVRYIVPAAFPEKSEVRRWQQTRQRRAPSLYTKHFCAPGCPVGPKSVQIVYRARPAPRTLCETLISTSLNKCGAGVRLPDTSCLLILLSQSQMLERPRFGDETERAPVGPGAFGCIR